MKRSMAMVLAVLVILLAGAAGQLPPATVRADPEWLDPNWGYRLAMTIANPCGQAVTGYQVPVSLGSSFHFEHARADGADLRVTGPDGVSPIPFWIETWNPAGTQATVWVKVPAIPTAGTTIYLYYGNPSPASNLVESPPVGPWSRAAGNPIVPSGGPANGRSLLAENIVYDAATGHYWMVHANYNDSGVGLVWSDTPADPASWHWQGTVLSSANAPHLVQTGGYWYIFYADRGHGGPPYPISVARASSAGGPYTYLQIVLSSSEPWEAYRVDEPYVFRRNDGRWIMVYMGDLGSANEQVGYAIADDIVGPYTKYAGNPVLPFGPPGAYDAGTVADPWVVEFHGTYYIGYTVSPTTSSPWQTAVATTTDWTTFTRQGVILPLGPSGAWDAANSFRGAVTRVGDTYVFAYTGDGYQMGIATQPVYLPANDQSAVFPFYDEFNDGVFDTGKWAFDSGGIGQVSESGGALTLTATSTYVKIHGSVPLGMDYLVEARARHPQAGTLNQIAEIGLCGASFGDVVRLADDFHNTAFWERQAKLTSTSGDPWTTTAFPADTGWHTFRVYRASPNVAGFQVDSAAAETTTTAVPTSSLPAFLMSYGSGSQLSVDWIRMRSWCGAEATATPGAEEPRPLSGHLTVDKTGDAQVLSGSAVHFNVTVTNDGDFALTNVTVTDALAPDCNRVFPSLAIDQSQAYACTLDNATQDLTNVAIASGAPPAGGAITGQDGHPVDVLHPAIAIGVTPAAQTVIEGTPAVFAVAVTNTGDVALQSVTVADVAVPDCARAIGSLAAGGSSRYTCTRANVTADFAHTAVVTSVGPLGSAPGGSAGAAVAVRGLEAAPWMDAGWSHRSPVVVSCPCGSASADYQVRIELTGANFDFDDALSDGSDLRVTAMNGYTALPFWIESWNAGSQQAAVWVKIPLLPLSGTAVYLYYGNPTPPGPTVVETPPYGPFTKAAGNPIVPDGGPANGRSLLAENIVYDAATGHYWMVHANYNDGGVGLVWSDTPTDPASWHWYGTVVTAANAPHILGYGGTWYIFFSDWSTPWSTTRHSIQVVQSASITGPYTGRTTVLSPEPYTWENWRVDEPYVFQRNDGTWVLLYMADQGDFEHGQFYYEQVGYATAPSLLGPYTKFAGNPALAWGPPGSFDAGTIADPWVVEFHGTYYIGYTVSPTTSSPWQTAVATTTDWTTFTKQGVILPLGASGAWDAANSFRGAVTRVGDTYVFAYTGDGYQMGIATQPVYVAEPMNDPAQVFNFYDGFAGDTLDMSHWTYRREPGSAGTATVSGGLLTLSITGVSSYDLIELLGAGTEGTGVLFEARARHPQADGSGHTAAELGFSDALRSNMIRIMDYNLPNFVRNTAAGGSGGNVYTPMARPLDAAGFLLHRVYRPASGQAWFSLENDAWEVQTASVPAGELPVWLMTYAETGYTGSLVVDWVRARNWCGADAAAEVRSGQLQPTAVLLAAFTARAVNGAAELRWQTESEVLTLGFYVYRGEAPLGPYVRVTRDLIPSAAPGSPLGAAYAWTDRTTTPGATYYYQLEDVDVHGIRTRHGPLRVSIPRADAHHVYLPVVIRVP